MHAAAKSQWRIKKVSPRVSRYAARLALNREISHDIKLERSRATKEVTKQRRFDRLSKIEE
jgi:hypothetical protein